MLPANLAKTRAAGRGTYGELLVLNGASSTSLGSVGQPTTATLRYAPYPLPATFTNQQHATATHHILPIHAAHSAAPSIIQYATTSQPFYDTALSYKRFLAASSAASLRHHPHHPLHPHHPHHPHHPQPTPRTTATLTYPLGDLLNIQGLDVSALYPFNTATLGI